MSGYKKYTIAGIVLRRNIENNFVKKLIKKTSLKKTSYVRMYNMYVCGWTFAWFAFDFFSCCLLCFGVTICSFEFYYFSFYFCFSISRILRIKTQLSKRKSINMYVHSIYSLLLSLPIASSATILTTDVGGSHSVTNASTAYCAKERQIIAICDGFRTNVDTHENKNAGAGPNASIKYAHSAPDDVFIVPNSAYARAPENRLGQMLIYCNAEKIFW